MPRPRGKCSLLLPLVVALFALVAPTSASASRSVRDSVPSPEQFLGYSIGERFTPYISIQSYSRLLATLSPLAEYQEYGRTPEERPLFHLVLTSPGNRFRLDSILSAHAELAEPATSAERAREIAAANPAVVYLTYGIHGNEASSSEAALWIAWDLLHDPTHRMLLDSLVVVMDPVANPDGRDRYVYWYQSVAASPPDPTPEAREHREPWPGGRFNHYLIDLNRDWAWATQPETRARLAAWWRWNPVVHVDFHEMGHESSYFFFPPAAPINPIYPPTLLRWAERFGAANARAFDDRGWPYFTGDAYDLFYPGYGDSWPSLLGAIGMTYEQAGGGVAGLAIRRPDGDTLTLRDRVDHHRVAGLTTLQTAATEKTALLLEFAASQREIGRDEQDVLLVPGTDTLRLTELVEHLRSQGVVVERAEREFRAAATPHPRFACRTEFPAGTYRVPARQARGRLAITLLAPIIPLNSETSYDISAWSLPYAYGVEAHRLRSGGSGSQWVRASDPVVASDAAEPAPRPGYGYLLDGSLTNAPGVIALLRTGVRLRVLSQPTTIDGIPWPEGSWFIPVLGNAAVREQVRRAGLGGAVRPVESGRAEAGTDLGSTHVWAVEMPRVAVLSGPGVNPSSFGSHWYFLEQIVGLPFLDLLLQDLPELDLSATDVIVLPDLLAPVLPPLAADALRNWVAAGGRLVAVAGGAGAVASLFDVQMRHPPTAVGSAEGAPLLSRGERLRKERQEEVSGAILELRVDSTHPLTWGSSNGSATPGIFTLHSGRRVFEPAPSLETAAYFPERLETTSGVIPADHLERLEHGAWLVTQSFGKGSVTLFADDPLFRLFWRQTHRTYLNALLIGPRR